MQPTTRLEIQDCALFCLFEGIDPSQIGRLFVRGKLYEGRRLTHFSLMQIRFEMRLAG
jgi:hypothetical protein